MRIGSIVLWVLASAPKDQPASVSASAHEVAFELETGSCWGQGSERRTVRIGERDVVIGSANESFTRPLAWWKETLGLLNTGLAASRARPKNGDCYLPNWLCGFRITVREGRQEQLITGCCNGSPEAAQVQTAFRRLTPSP